jgi:adenylate cyclase
LLAYLEAEIDGVNRTFPIPREFALCIGRSGSVCVTLDDDSVSRRHALLQRTGADQYYVVDLGSRNGTYLNQKRVSAPSILKPDDRILIGKYTLTFHAEEDHAIATRNSGLGSTNATFSPGLISVMVADIRDFTRLAQRLEAGPLSLVTGTLFRKAGKVLQEHGAWAQKYIGDAVMAVWLHESQQGCASELRPLFEAISQLAEIADSLQGKFGLDAPIRIGVGVNTGWASVGNVGSIANSDYTAVGEVVNKAFRLESATKELGCDLVLGQATYDLLGCSMESDGGLKACSVKLKGYQEPVSAYASQGKSLAVAIQHLVTLR